MSLPSNITEQALNDAERSLPPTRQNSLVRTDSTSSVRSVRSESGKELQLRKSRELGKLHKSLAVGEQLAKKGLEFKSLTNLTNYERNKYSDGTKTIKMFNNNPTPISMMNAIIARNDLVEFGLISPASKTITKLDKTIAELINSDEFIARLDDRQIKSITQLQGEYNAVVEKIPKKSYYTKKKGVPTGYYEPSEVDPNEAIDRAVEEKDEMSDINEVLTEAEAVESDAPTVPASPALSVSSVFSANRMDATTYRPPSEASVSSSGANPMPMSMDGNLIESSIESLEAEARDTYKTFFDNFGIEDLQLARDFVEKQKYEDLDQQRELLRELTEQIELLSGGQRDSLFNASDLQTAKSDNVGEEIKLTADGNALSGFERNRNSMNLNNIELDAIDNFFNNDNEDPNQANSIGYGVSQFGNEVFRNIYGSGMEIMNPIRPAETIAQNIRNRYEVGEDWFGRDGKREKGFISETAPDLSNRFERMNMVTLNKDFTGLGKFNPYVNNNADLMLGHFRDNIGAPRWSDLEGERIRQEKRAQLQQAMAEQQGASRQMEGAQMGMPTGVAPPSIGQLRGQQIDYKTPNNKLRNDAINLLRLSNKTGLELNNEFAP